SMRSRRNKVNGKLKIDVAKEVMSEIVGLLPSDSQVGLRVYGHRKKEGTKGDCQDSQLVVRIGDLDRKKLLAAVKNIKALGTTPIAYSLQQAGKDLARIEGPKLIVLVTDGKEECKGDPAAVVTELREQGIDVQLDIVGFALAEEKVKQDMQRAAEAGGGRFFDAQDRDALAAAIRKTLAMPFDVLDGHNRQVATGLTGQDPLEMHQGDYSVIVRTAKGDVTLRDVRVTEGRSTAVLLTREEDGIRATVSEAGPAQ
ncbi:MAG: VWA domain-containing protein, partial [Rhodospirillales bacterium]